MTFRLDQGRPAEMLFAANSWRKSWVKAETRHDMTSAVITAS